MPIRKSPTPPSCFRQGPDSILKKIGEECAELIMAAKDGKRLNIVWESTDVIYHVLVLLAFYGLSIEDVVAGNAPPRGDFRHRRKGGAGQQVSDCIFCKIVEGKIPAQKVYEDEDILAFNDINPARPVHVLVIPKKAHHLAGDGGCRRYAGAGQDAGQGQRNCSGAGQPGRFPRHHQYRTCGAAGSPASARAYRGRTGPGRPHAQTHLGDKSWAVFPFGTG